LDSPRDKLVGGWNKPVLTVEEEVRMKEWGTDTILKAYRMISPFTNA
jgi:hypothetical protein